MVSPSPPSVVDGSIQFDIPTPTLTESQACVYLIRKLRLEPHPEGCGYMAVTNINPLKIPNPFPDSHLVQSPADDDTRAASSAVFNLLTPHSPLTFFHKNKGLTMHALHHGRARYILINGCGKIRTFEVGQELEHRNQLQWSVDGGVWKAAFLIPEKDIPFDDQRGILISEILSPGFDPRDHELMTLQKLVELVGADQAKTLGALIHTSASTPQ